jgi:hypothetical protein
MANDNSAIDRAEIAADLERARVEFHRLLTETERKDAWSKPTRGTRWTNDQLLFHMVFGYMIVQRLLILVKVFSRLPGSVSRVFAVVLNAATRPFDVINYYGSLVYNRHRMGAKMDRVIAALQRNLARESENAFHRGMHERRLFGVKVCLPHTLGPHFQGVYDARRRLPLPRPAFRLPQSPTDPQLHGD